MTQSLDKSSNTFLTMNYVTSELQELIQDRFEQAWLQNCYTRLNMYHTYNTLASTSSSLVIRSLLHSNHITAHLRGDILFASPCTPVKLYYLRTVNKCYVNIPIQFILNNHTVNNAFLKSNNLREITYNDLPTACNQISTSYFRATNGSYLKWDGKSIQILPTDHLHVTTLSLAITFSKIDNFHLNYDKMFDENENTIDHVQCTSPQYSNFRT